ncbi:hypothetical protein [Natronomonas moolapensis]|uniref:hypothetical protein n=1 Tax=Natronomonas moolapensis TaxID=416273 RepID=UPI0006778BFA|nr:hypothetical protein [Natronomonas moolapensis]
MGGRDCQNGRLRGTRAAQRARQRLRRPRGGCPEPGRFDGARAELEALQERAEVETRKLGADARGWIDAYRSERRES